MDRVSHLHCPGVRNITLSFPKLENVSGLFSSRPPLSHLLQVSASKCPYPVTQCERKQCTFTIPHFKYREQKRFGFNSPCLCKRIKTTAPPACLPASTPEAEHLSSKEEDPLRCIAAPVPPPCWLPPGTLCSSSRRASTAKWWLWHLLSLLNIGWLHTGWSFLSPQFQQ